MGKDAKHQRTKGGVQPSNASRAAKLLEKAASPASANSFLAASAEVRNDYSLLESPVHSSLLVDDDLPPEVRMVFRKLLKKDGTTKIKALSELTLLIEPSPEEPTQDISNIILPQWTKLYPKLTQDESRKVRELAQSTHTIVCKAVGRSLAKHLRQLMPYWFISQFDLYGPVASAAKKSFCTVFPTESKRLDALKYCCNEILAYLKSNFEGSWRNGVQQQESDVRLVIGSIWCLAEMIKLSLVEETYLGKLFGDNGLFWSGVNNWAECSMVLKPAVDLLTLLLQQTQVPSKNLTKILHLSNPEVAPNLFNLLQICCQRQLVTRSQAKSLLLSSATTHLHSTNVVPVFEYALQSDAELLSKLLNSLSKGLQEEKSLNNRVAAIRQTLLLINHDKNLIFKFLVQHLQTACASDLPAQLARLIEHNEFEVFWKLVHEQEKLNSKEFGSFVAGLVGLTERRVVFSGGDEEEEKKRAHENMEVVRSAVRYCVDQKAFVPVAMLSRKLGKEIWGSVELDLVELDHLDEHLKLRLVLDLMQLHESPKLLVHLSNLLDHYYSSSNLLQLLKELTPSLHLLSIRKWVMQDTFQSKLHQSIANLDSQSEIHAFLDFTESLDSPELVVLIQSRSATDQLFNATLVLVLLNRKANGLFTPLYESNLNRHLENLINNQPDEPTESLVLKVPLPPETVLPKLDATFGCARSVAAVDKLVEFAFKYKANNWLSIPKLRISSGVLAFLHHHYDPQCVCVVDSLEQIHEFGELERLVVIKSLAYGKLDLGDLVQRFCLLVYAQAVCLVWDQMASLKGAIAIEEEFKVELRVTWCRVLEELYLTEQWSAVPEHLKTLKLDSLWESGLPYRIFLRHCLKSELHIDLENDQQLPEVNVEHLDHLMLHLKHGIIMCSSVGSWLVELRKTQVSVFSFDVLFRNIQDLHVASKLLLLTVYLLKHTDDQSLLSTLSCWVASWVNGIKYVEASKSWCYWTTLLSKAVKIISQRAQDCEQFAIEYREFLCGKLYLNLYLVFVELSGTQGLGWWGDYTLCSVGAALSSIPQNVLGQVEPECMKIVDQFVDVLTNDAVPVPARVAAYNVLAKVKYEKDLPIVPPSIDAKIKLLADQLHDETRYTTFLLVWDALLKIQQHSNEFASYVRDQSHLLRLLLDSLFFSQNSTIESATAKHFDTAVVLEPFRSISLLHLSCSVLLRALRNLPYTVRWWWNNHVTKQRDRVFVEKFVVKHLSSRLAAEELKNAQVDEEQGNPVTIHCHSGCNELVAHYRIEETNVTLTISLPLNHPLGPVTVRISDKKLHAKISHLLNTRSHSLSAGLKLWKETLDSLYKDVDECAICFFILHHVTKQTPKLGCKTCRKKFHAACLYKWFSTSNKSECPLCRNLF